MKRVSKKLPSVAYHEAGHAVVRQYQGLRRPRYVTIIPDEYNFGHVSGSAFPSGFNPDIQRFNGRTQLLLEREIRVLYAGSLAERKFNPHGYRHFYAAGDYRKIADYVYWLAEEQKIVDVYLELLKMQTDSILDLDNVWSCIEAVAAALLEKKKLKGKEVWEIIHDHYRHYTKPRP